MAAVTIRNIPDEVHRALKAQAASHGRSTEAEIREILRTAVTDGDAPGAALVATLADIRHAHGGFDLEIERDPAPIEPAGFA